jgi:hypothetical protein
VHPIPGGVTTKSLGGPDRRRAFITLSRSGDGRGRLAPAGTALHEGTTERDP